MPKETALKMIEMLDQEKEQITKMFHEEVEKIDQMRSTVAERYGISLNGASEKPERRKGVRRKKGERAQDYIEAIMAPVPKKNFTAEDVVKEAAQIGVSLHEPTIGTRMGKMAKKSLLIWVGRGGDHWNADLERKHSKNRPSLPLQD